MLNRKSFASTSLVVLCTAVFASGAPQTQGSLSKGLVHWWKFNGTCMDSAGELDLKPIGPIEFVRSPAGYGIDFDGSTTGISIPPFKELQFENSFSISAWAYLRSYPKNGKLWSSIIFDGDDRNGLDPYALQVNGDGKMAFLITGEPNDLSEIQAPMPLRKFVLVTGTYDKQTGSQRLYLDGKLVGTQSEKYSLTPVCALVDGQHAGIGIGTNNGFPKGRYNFGWDGVINDLRIYDRALTIGEIQTLYKMSSKG